LHQRHPALRTLDRDRPVHLRSVRGAREALLRVGRHHGARLDSHTGRDTHYREHATTRAGQPARGGGGAWCAAMESDLLCHGARRKGGDHHRHPPRGGAYQRRDGASPVHGAQQPVLVHQLECAHGQPSRGDLPVCDEPVRELAASGLGWRAADNAQRARAEHLRARGLPQQDAGVLTMNAAVLQSSPETVVQKIAVRDLNFYYGGFHALKDINLGIPERKVTAFIGPSGCGKSTLLRTFNRMYALYPNQEARGEILLDGENILSPGQDLNRLRAKVGMVFQKPTPFPMSIYDNIAFGVRLYESLSAREMEERVEWALRKAALGEEVKDKLKQGGTSLSGGQQQRLCIARGIAVKPEVLLLDEPCSALDPISTGRIEELVHELKS